MENIAATRKLYLDGFHIAFDHWHRVDAPENHALVPDTYCERRKNELIDERTSQQAFGLRSSEPLHPAAAHAV